MKRTWLLIALLVSCSLPRISAQPAVTAVVVIEGLTWEQIERGESGALYVLARHRAIGLMSVGASSDTGYRFALTLQTGRRLAFPKVATPASLRQRYGHLRWLTDTLEQAGVRITTHFQPPQEYLQSLLDRPRSLASPTAEVQIWWLRGTPSTIGKGLENAIGSLNPERDSVLIVGLPPSGERLAPVIMAGRGLSTGILTSDTTRTRGLISDVDIAPTLLRWHGVAPRADEHPIHVVQEDNPFPAVQQVARQCRWNVQGLIPIGALQAIGGLLAVFATLGTIRRRTASRRAKLLLSVAIGTLLSLPAGTILAPYFPATMLWQYIGAMVLSAVCLSLWAHWGAWEEPYRAYTRACALSVLVILVDGVSGQHGIKSSMYSAYALSGIRFYGIGNEMMGVLIGCALAWGLYGLGEVIRAPLWAAVAIVLVMPAWGANLGGLLTAGTGFGCAWEITRAKGEALPLRSIRWLGVAVLLAVVIMWIDSLSVSPSHIGEAWMRWRAEGWQAVLDTLASKLALTGRVLTSPFTWAVLAVIVLALWAMARSGTLKSLGNGWRSENTAWLVCILSAFVFNDSGFVPAAAILGIWVGAVLTRRLQEVDHDSSARPGGLSGRIPRRP
ncbi:MAG: hypothetical protein ACUVSV_02745 [Armatimonadota bacterium]